MNSGSIRHLSIEQRVYLHGELVNTQILPSCANCIHSEAMPNGARAVDAFCTKYKAFPPLEVLVAGCVGWDEEIPF